MKICIKEYFWGDLWPKPLHFLNKEGEKIESGCLIEVDKISKRPIILTWENRKQQGRYLNSENHRIIKVTPKNVHKNIENFKKRKCKALINKTQCEAKQSETPMNSYLMIQSNESIPGKETRENRVSKTSEESLNQRFVRNYPTTENSSNTSGNKFCFIENSNSEIPMSYRAQTEDSLTPYTNSKSRREFNNKNKPQAKNRTGPMSYTFHNPTQSSSQKAHQNRMMGSHLIKESARYKHITRPTSRRARAEKLPLNNTKRVKRAETMLVASPVSIPEAKIKLRKEMDEMASLKYHISQTKIDKEYRITSTVLGTGSYAIVKLGESLKNPDK